MKAEYTIKINDVFYKAGEELPESFGKEVEAVATEEVVPPLFMNPPEEATEEPVKEEPKEQKRQYRRRKQ